jgi:hypothetical protein
MWESITRGKETKGTIVMLHVDRNSEQDNRMMGNGDKDEAEKYWSIHWNRNREKGRVDYGLMIGVPLDVTLEWTWDPGL